MASGPNTGRHGNDINQLAMEWRIGKYHHQYPPPEALPEYVNRALPPRPGSNSSSSYDSLNEGAPIYPMLGHQLAITQPQDGHHNYSPAGIIDEAEFATVQPLQIPTAASSAPQLQQMQQQQQQQPVIACPQPRYPAYMVLEIREHDDVVSPISAPLSDNNNHEQHEVSPISPAESECSVHSASSNSEKTSSVTQNHLATKGGTDSTGKGGGRYQPTQLATNSITTNSRAPYQPIEQINLRYSDPGSPISGAVVHPPSSFPSDPNLRLLRDSFSNCNGDDNNAQNTGAPLLPQNPPSRGDSRRKRDSGIKLASPTGASTVGTIGGPPKIAFAGAGARTDGFSTRARANSKRTAPPPPPLKLSERPLVDKYVKTPFPDIAVEPGQKRGSLHKKSASEGREEGKKRDKHAQEESVAEKRNRGSSLPERLGLGFARSFIPGNGSSHGGGGGCTGSDTQGKGAAAQKQNEGTRKEGKTETGPKRMKSILSKAKQLGLGHGLGIGIGSEEARKEKRRAEMKRQIRIGEPRA